MGTGVKKSKQLVISVIDLEIIAKLIDTVLNQDTDNDAVKTTLLVLDSIREKILIKWIKNYQDKNSMIHWKISYIESSALRYLFNTLDWIDFDSYVFALIIHLKENFLQLSLWTKKRKKR